MDLFKNQYLIHSGTIALLPAKRLGYETLVMETDQEIYVKESPREIMDNLLEHKYSSFQARRETIFRHTGFKRKVPIPIDLDNHYLFPTHAMKDYDCAWISAHHVEDVTAGAESGSSRLLFSNGSTLEVEQSVYSMNRQIERTKVVRDKALAIREKLTLVSVL